LSSNQGENNKYFLQKHLEFSLKLREKLKKMSYMVPLSTLVKKSTHGFTWIVDGKIAGQCYPESEEMLQTDVKKNGIGVVISLTEKPLEYNVAAKKFHIPIRGLNAFIS
jgi:hypothetical protein